MWVVPVAFLLSVAGGWLAYAPSRASSTWVWLALGLVQLPLALVALVRMYREGTIAERMQPRWGDISLGAGSALMLYAVTWAGRVWITPSGTPREGWLVKVYLQLGDPKVVQDNLTLLGIAILMVAACDELAWRGLVLRVLEERVGSRRAWWMTAVLYGVSLAPTVWLLRTEAGPNPLVMAAAVAGGVVWSLIAQRSQRLLPAILSHGLYLWFVVAQFRLFGI
ncbi:MAG TPA: CPBP family intramembrane metalloprotease [Polyangiaceae bacterium]|nr:CPBP family intramembrane metalloprotease [Polyangiaceae bacterium]